MATFGRITQNPGTMGGKPCIRGLRVTVGMIVGQIGAGHTVEEVLADFPYLEREDVIQALRDAAWRARSARSSWAGHEGSRRHGPVGRWTRHLAEAGIEVAHWS
jgi:uncharacterized protein (DUF433 family)